MKLAETKSGLRRVHCTALMIVVLVGMPTSGPSAAAHAYSIRVDASLSSVQVEARLAEPGLWLSATRGGSSRLLDVAGCSGESVQQRGSALRVSGDCLRYTASIKPPVSGQSRRAQWPHAGHKYWLWLPPLAEGDVVRISLDLPAGVQAFVPWRRIDPTRYELRPSPGSGDSLAWFGPLTESSLLLQETGSATSIPLFVVDTRLSAARMTDWLTEAAGLVAGVGGGFPNPHAQVVVESGETSVFGDSVVPFGHVMRSGEEVVRFFVKPGASLDALRSDWTAVHEFAHLLLPYVREDQKWISEGFASYYQNVLLVRGGIYSETEGWRRLVRSFDIAANTRDPVSPNGTAERPFWDARMMIYWSGASLALMMDVELRQQTAGRQSLDSVLGQFADCCLPSSRTWEGRELFARLDTLSGTNVFTRNYDRYADRPGMPPYAQTLKVIGVKFNGNAVQLDDLAPLAAIRSTIMRRKN